MKSAVVISGLGQHSSLGQGILALKLRISSKEKVQPKSLAVKTKEGMTEISVLQAGEVELPSSVPDSIARRMSRISKMSFVAVAEAIADSGIKTSHRVGLVVGCAFGSLDLINEFEKRIYLEGPLGASPRLFTGSVQNSIASHLSIAFEIKGPTATIMIMEQTTIGSLRLAFDWIEQDLADHVVVVLTDEISEFHSYANASVPKDQQKVLGEGAVGFVLSKSDLALKKHAEIVEIKPHCEELPSVERHFSKQHEDIYGAMATGAAFEIAAAALCVSEDRIATSCSQTTEFGEMQSLVLR